MSIFFELIITFSILFACVFICFFEHKTFLKNQEYLKHKDELVLLQSSVLLKHLSEDH